MKYNKAVILKNNKECLIRNAKKEDAKGVLENFALTLEETDYMRSLKDENKLSLEMEIELLSKKSKSEDEIIMVAIIDDKIVGLAGVNKVGENYKIKHRASLGIGINKAYWNLGIGSFLTNACIECAKNAEYKQLELDVVSDNVRAMSMYKKIGFIEYGRNPLGFNSPISGYQELVYMRLELG